MQTMNQEEHELLRDTAARFFEEQSPITELRRLRDAADADGIDRNLWQAMVEMGWSGILVDEAHGGIDFGYRALGSIFEQAGRHLSASPLFASVALAAPLIASGGNAKQKEALLPSLCSGDCLLALALDERSRHNPHAISTKATPQGDSFVISGEKQFVLDGHIADKLIVVARSSGEETDASGLSLFLLDSNQAGVTITRTAMVDSRNAAKISFDNVTLGKEAVIGELGRANTVLEPALDGARALIAAEMLGSGQQAFDRTIDYLKVREQFGAPLGSFQALKHRAAEMYCELELARSATYGALDAIDNRSNDSAELASLAKTKACEMIELVSNEAVQMHGGIGMTDAADIGLFLKRARVTQQILGDAFYHRNRYADLVGI